MPCRSRWPNSSVGRRIRSPLEGSQPRRDLEVGGVRAEAARPVPKRVLRKGKDPCLEVPPVPDAHEARLAGAGRDRRRHQGAEGAVRAHARHEHVAGQNSVAQKNRGPERHEVQHDLDHAEELRRRDLAVTDRLALLLFLLFLLILRLCAVVACRYYHGAAGVFRRYCVRLSRGLFRATLRQTAEADVAHGLALQAGRADGKRCVSSYCARRCQKSRASSNFQKLQSFFQAASRHSPFTD